MITFKDDMAETFQRESNPRLMASTVMYGGAARQEAGDGQLGFLRDLKSVSWPVEYKLGRRLGSGGQGVVYLAERVGAEGLRMPVSLKFFSPDRYKDAVAYQEDMGRVAQITAKLATIQQDHLIDVHNFVDFNGIRVMAMEWVDGFDLDYLLQPETLIKLRSKVTPERWTYLNNVVVTLGHSKARLKPGIAIAIARECLVALASLHRAGIIHGDIKPANVMLKKTGHSKIIDLGSACESDDLRGLRPFTPQYAAPEVLDQGVVTPYSDLASLGYVLVEMLSGRAPFAGIESYMDLVRAKHRFADDLPEYIPADIGASESLMNLLRVLVSPNPLKRFPSEEAADFLQLGAAEFQRELVTGNLASEYEMEIRLWLEDLA